MSEDYNQGYEEGIREAEKHLVDPDVIGSINDQHIDEMNRMQDDYCKQIDSLENRIKDLEKENERLKKNNDNLQSKYINAVQLICGEHDIETPFSKCECDFCNDHREILADGYEGEVGFKEQRKNKGE